LKKILLFLRHGKTNYTGVFPDLTDEGKREIENTAERIARIAKGMEGKTIIVSSPTTRALGSADIIAKRLGYPSQIVKEQALRCMDFYDPEKANEIWKEFPTARDVDRAYASDPRFEKGTVIEKRSAIQYRFFAYLGTLFEKLPADDSEDIAVIVSHYELLWSLASIFHFKDPLIHGELIRLDLSYKAVSPEIQTSILFRNCARSFNCRPPVDAFMHQFDLNYR